MNAPTQVSDVTLMIQRVSASMAPALGCVVAIGHHPVGPCSRVTLGRSVMSMSRESRAAVRAEGMQIIRGALDDSAQQKIDFHIREAEKYEAKAVELEGQGKAKAAARMRKVADRNRAAAAKRMAG